MQDKIEYFSVNNWDKFQHYKDRNPPWIRLYTALLDDYKFQKLAKNNQRVLILLWLVAAKTGNEIPFDIPYLERFIPGITKENVIELSHSGFLNASTTLAGCKHDASKSLSHYRSTEDRSTEVQKADKRGKRAPASAGSHLSHLIANLHWSTLQRLGSKVCETEDKEKWIEKQARAWDVMVKHGVTQADAEQLFVFVTSDSGVFWRDKIASASNLWTLKDGKRKIHSIMDQIRNGTRKQIQPQSTSPMWMTPDMDGEEEFELARIQQRVGVANFDYEKEKAKLRARKAEQ